MKIFDITKELRYRFDDVIDVKGVPTKALPNTNYEINPFSDMGAWHAYHLPSLIDTEYYGGFTGPLCIVGEYGIWLSKCFNLLKVYETKTKKEFKLSNCKNPQLVYYPGVLVQNYDMEMFEITIELRFATNRTALVTTRIKNKTDSELQLNLTWNGNVFDDIKTEFISLPDGLKLKIFDVNVPWKVCTSKEMIYEIRYPFEVEVELEYKSYIMYKDDIILKANEEYIINATNTYTLTELEFYKEEININKILKKPDKYIDENSSRWNKYLLLSLKDKNYDYDIAIVKAIETLIINWRSPAGAIKKNGIIPSISYRWFNGLWAWDSWKHAVATVCFEPEIAKDNIRAMFDYQKENGMVIDAIFYDYKGDNWNERNSKPPLAAWAVWKVYEATNEKEFLEEMYPKLVEYHYWWYTHRDNDKNGIVEYGASVDKLNNDKESIIQSSAWESGMDNAIRFDMDYGIKVLKNSDNKGKLLGYSIDQESVDLNAYLYAEKIFLSSMAKVLGKMEEYKKYIEESKHIKKFIQSNMFNKEEEFYFDVDITNKRTLTERGKGIEGIIPLWAGVASGKQAEILIKHILNENEFNTNIPIPAASKDNSRYDPEKYWRGPVWLDQAYFAIEGLDRYGYRQDAINLSKKLMDNAEGINSKGKPVRENYNPETGKGLNCTNFSWSAGMIYLICKNYLLNND